jgi:hypothetical protein
MTMKLTIVLANIIIIIIIIIIITTKKLLYWALHTYSGKC